MNEEVAIIECVYDIVLPEVPASLHRWGRKFGFEILRLGQKENYYTTRMESAKSLALVELLTLHESKIV
ncbi:hypothetical protein [Desulfosporosinus sp. HMP52]|uniref:hypothetical protein n=1 Tax=Desulfosporosinus sp. HMP52 TaxID=1487923 RepID=UPI001FA7E943|nr:hypothetical protein [Desulfosporosinus sp. HMP52]